MSNLFDVNVTWVHDAVRATDPAKLIHPPPSATGFDMTWVIDPRVIYACAVSVAIACVVSFLEIRSQAINYDFPKIQVYVIRIVFMIPFYGVLSLASVMFHHLRFFLDTVRDTYESFVLYTFFTMLVEYCGGEGALLRSLNTKKYPGVHPMPLCCLPHYPLNTDFYLRCKRYVLQYALIKPLSSFLTCVGAPLGLYKEASFTYDNLYPYLLTINNISISYSLYYLVLFHLETERELAYCKPGMKFICIKSIIFFAFWQSVTIGVCIALGWVYTGGDEETREKVNTAIQDVLMCFELLPVAFMHHWAFGVVRLHEEMAAQPVLDSDDVRTTGGAKKHLDEALSLTDVFQDIIATIFYSRQNLIGASGEPQDDDDDFGDVRMGDVGLTQRDRRTVLAPNDEDAPHVVAMTMAKHAETKKKHREADRLKQLQQNPTAEDASSGVHVEVTDEMVEAATMAYLRQRAAQSNKVQPSAVAVEDPTPEQLVMYCVEHDRGIRADGLVHYDADEETDAVNQAITDNHTDDTLCFANAPFRPDEDPTKVDKAAEGPSDGPAAYCVVCGRYDRQLVKRKAGLKCTNCVGTKSKSALRAKAVEKHSEDNDGSCAVCGRKGRPMVRRGARFWCIDCVQQHK